VLLAHRARLVDGLNKAKASGADTELFEDEIGIVDECIAAPQRPITSNYECATPLEII